MEVVKHEIAPSFSPSHRGKMVLITPDNKERGIRKACVLVLFQISVDYFVLPPW